jgi:hypothetical protein
METVIVCSKIVDENISHNLVDSLIWKDAKHLDEIEPDDVYDYCQYHIKFDGLIPVQITRIITWKRQ